MHIIWKRPDGFQNSVPDDFERVQLSNGSQLWLHKSEKDWYPFQVSGDWAGQEETQKLNKLINSLLLTSDQWQFFFNDLNKEKENSAHFASSITKWLDKLMVEAKGQTWELEIVHCALQDIKKRFLAYCH